MTIIKIIITMLISASVCIGSNPGSWEKEAAAYSLSSPTFIPIDPLLSSQQELSPKSISSYDLSSSQRPNPQSLHEFTQPEPFLNQPPISTQNIDPEPHDSCGARISSACSAVLVACCHPLLRCLPVHCILCIGMICGSNEEE